MLDASHEWNISFKPVIAGFALSLILTIAAYFIAGEHIFTGWTAASAIIGLGGLQVLIQLIFFLHLGVESKPRWKLMMFLLMLLVVAVVVIGTIWIMSNLDYNLMSTTRH
ncbi:MAG: cytochrome C oxidase subunit IV family protein [Waddliaceae bacterium]